MSNEVTPTSSKTLYALLIAIDDYLVVGDLRGCVNDSLAIEKYLIETVGKRPNWQVKILTLRNHEATRANIIKGYLEHLTKAQEGDMVFVHYSGHGSQETADKLFWKMEPDHRNETMVCYDSRSRGPDGSTIWDIADKETAWMLSQVAKNNPHITVIFDCCHSGSGTREMVRHSAMANYVRPAENYVFVEQDPIYRDLLDKPDEFDIPKTQHLFFSGCSSSQTAKEMRAENGKSYGAFTYSLLETLKKAGGQLSYRDIITRAGSLVANRANAQTPQLEAHEGADIHQIFLNGAATKTNNYFTAKYENGEGWLIDGGSFNGIPNPLGSDKTILHLYDESVENITDAQHLYEAEVTTVMPAESKINILDADTIDTTQVFKAIIVELPVSKLKVHFKAETPGWDALDEGVELLKKAFKNEHLDEKPALFLEIVGEREGADYKVIVYEHFAEFKYRITKAHDEIRPVAEQVKGLTARSANEIIRQLMAIARWEMVFNLQNVPRGIMPSDISLEVSTCVMDEHTKEIQDEKWLTLNSGEIELPYLYDETKKTWTAPEFRAKITNNSNRTVYCSLLALVFDYSITNALLPRAELQPGETAYAFDGESVQATVRDSLYEMGITQVRDSLLLLVSTEDFNSEKLTQSGQKVYQRHRNSKNRNTLELLFSKKNTRDYGRKKQSLPTSDWFTHRISTTVIRPLDKTSAKVLEASGIELPQDHPLQADIRLACTEHGQRMRGGHSNDYIPEILLDQGETTETINLVSSRGTAPELNVLELHNVQNADSVSPENPFTIHIPAELVGENNMVLPIAKDGDLFLPLGLGVVDGEKVAVKIERLPQPSIAYSRSLGNTIKILFQKVIGKKLGWGYEYPYLALVSKNDKNELTYQPQPLHVAEAIGKTHFKKIALVMHSFNGETRDIFQPDQNQPSTPFFTLLNTHYDLVLAFDYDSYGTSLEKTASDLKVRLKNVGLAAGHDKTLHIFAHAMGGLISRQFIEKEGGNTIVQHLIMLGTPNDGSPWPTVLDWTKTGLTLVLNKMTFGTMPVLTLLTEGLKKVQPLLGDVKVCDQVSESMKKASDFLENLNRSDDPQVRYTIIAGNTSLIADAHFDKEKKVGRILNKLGITANAHHDLIDLLFRQKNDMAVSISSMGNLSGNRKPTPILKEVASDHLSYFSSEEGLKVIQEVLKNE